MRYTIITVVLVLLSLRATAQDNLLIFCSTDQGSNWTDFANGLPEDVLLRQLFEANRGLYLASQQYGLYFRSAASNTWSAVEGEGLPYNQDFFQPTALYVKEDTMLLGTYAHGIFLSYDGGKKWRRPEQDIPTMARNFVPSPAGLLSGSDKGIWRSTDGGLHWELYSTDQSQINGLIQLGDRIIVSEQNGLGYLSGKDIIWSDQQSDSAIVQLLTAGDYVYALNFQRQIFRSKDGVNWETGPKAQPAGDCQNLTDALWGGYWPDLGQGRSIDGITPTSFGWIGLSGIGCKLPE